MYISTNNNNNNKIYNPITSQRFQYGLCDGMLKTSLNILELNLNGNDLGNNGIKYLCNALSNMKNDGGGMKIFCAGIGVNHPDITNASRAIKSKEKALCEKNGVKFLAEFDYEKLY